MSKAYVLLKMIVLETIPSQFTSYECIYLKYITVAADYCIEPFVTSFKNYCTPPNLHISDQRNDILGRVDARLHALRHLGPVRVRGAAQDQIRKGEYNNLWLQ